MSDVKQTRLNLSVEDNKSSMDWPKRFYARAIVRRMRGVTRADLVNTDGGLYVVKWKQNPVHRRVLINSLVGAELLRRMDIATPEWALICADAEFCRSQLPGLQPGLHFGLLRPGDATTSSVYDSLPSALAGRIINRADFVRAMVFDCWVDNAHQRQSIFTPLSTDYYGQMVGNGHILGFRRGAWSFSSQPEVRLPLPVPPSVYLSATAITLIDVATAQIQQTAAPILDSISRLIPDDWLESDYSELGSVFEKLSQRTALLADITKTWLAQLPQSESRY